MYGNVDFVNSLLRISREGNIYITDSIKLPCCTSVRFLMLHFVHIASPRPTALMSTILDTVVVGAGFSGNIVRTALVPLQNLSWNYRVMCPDQAATGVSPDDR